MLHGVIRHTLVAETMEALVAGEAPQIPLMLTMVKVQQGKDIMVEATIL